MSRSSSLLAVALVASLPLAAGAQEAAYQGLALDLSHLTGHPRQTDIQVSGTSDLHFGDWLGFQGDIGAQRISAHHDSRNAAWADGHAYFRPGYGLAFGAYLKGWGAKHSAGGGGIEMAWQSDFGFGAEAFLGKIWGDEMRHHGHAITKGAQVSYEFVSGPTASLYFNKDSAHRSGHGERDYYDYGLGVDLPLGASESTRLSAKLGRVRFDAEDRGETKFALGLAHQFGGSEVRPTFSRKRSVLADLAGY